MTLLSPLPSDIAFALAEPRMPVPPPLPAERSLLSGSAALERVAEFGRGRHCARLALAELGWPDAESQVILRSGARAPNWPAGLVGAITHTRGWAAAAVARGERYAGVGLDLETARSLSAALIRRIALPEEQEGLAGGPTSGRPAFGPPGSGSPAPTGADDFALLFSAKESIYKALNPATGVFLGYHDARVWLDGLEGPDCGVPASAKSAAGADTPGCASVGARTGTWRWELRSPAGADFPAGFRGEGGWSRDGERVLTGTWVRRKT